MHNSGKVLISHALAKRLLPLTLSVFVLIALVLPLSFGAIEYRRLANTAGTHARQLADLITTIAATSPRLWKFQAIKYSEVMNTFLPHKGIAAIDILDEGKAPVNQFNHTASHGMFSSWAVEGEPAAIALNNMRIGEVRIRLDASSAALMVALLLSGCVLIGGLLCLFLYRLPLRVVWKLERQLLAYQDSLEDLVRERTDALQDARFKAESANRAKGLFLANMSHEIRTPMNAILGMTHLAMQARSDDQRRHFLETVQHSSESLLGLLNDILDFSKMEAGQLQLNPLPFNLRRLLHGIVSTMGVSATEKGLTLTAHIADDLPEVLIGDDMRLRQILLNPWGMKIAATVILSSWLGSLLASQLLGMPFAHGLAMSSSFGWYSLSGILVADKLGPVLGSAAFINDLGRELIAILLIPVLMRRHPSAAIGYGGATALDFTLPVIQKSGGIQVVPVAIVSGFILSLLGPILILGFLAI